MLTDVSVKRARFDESPRSVLANWTSFVCISLPAGKSRFPFEDIPDAVSVELHISAGMMVMEFTVELSVDWVPVDSIRLTLSVFLSTNLTFMVFALSHTVSMHCVESLSHTPMVQTLMHCVESRPT